MDVQLRSWRKLATFHAKRPSRERRSQVTGCSTAAAARDLFHEGTGRATVDEVSTRNNSLRNFVIKQDHRTNCALVHQLHGVSTCVLQAEGNCFAHPFLHTRPGRSLLHIAGADQANESSVGDDGKVMHPRLFRQLNRICDAVIGGDTKERIFSKLVKALFHEGNSASNWFPPGSINFGEPSTLVDGVADKTASLEALCSSALGS